MKVSLPAIVLTAPATAINLPDSFKELQAGDCPVRIINTLQGDSSQAFPCIVYTKREMERQYAKFAYGINSSYFRYDLIRLPIYLDRSAGIWTLNVRYQPIEQISFLIDAYCFMPDPSADTDTNYFLDEYADMCMAAAKAIVFEVVNDEIAGEFETNYARKFKKAAYDDAYRQTRGVKMQM